MFSFLIAAVLLILGYFFYGKIVEKNFVPDERMTPANEINDGVDYVPMKTWKVFLIQFLNIAGTGPIFGALAGALFGPVAYLWIVFGCIFAGAVHDYMCGMISVREKGASVSEIVGNHLGNGMKMVMRVFSVVLLILCGVVFTIGPAELIAILTPETLDIRFWIIVISVYYFVATFLPIDKVIGKIYPVFGGCLIIMAVGVVGSMLFSGKFQMPEVWNHFENLHPKEISIWPFMFVTIACGAISGFHATQSPLMARCLRTEKDGRKVFYGAMIAEGLLALIWCAAGNSCFASTQELLAAGGGCSAVVYQICSTTMGKVGMVFAIIGVVVCPISSGDTAYRSARLTLADWFSFDQSKIKNRLILTVPLLLLGVVVGRMDYQVVWRYFSWSNQTLAMIVLWACSIYLLKNKRNPWMTVIPACFMTAVSVTYFMVAPECIGGVFIKCGIDKGIYEMIGMAVGILVAALFFGMFLHRMKKEKEILM